ncbi:hypothetical protein ACNO8S_16350 (plasmid) [Haloarcula sp. KBTZ06]|uniref:hypothetical protein n=1 Tax=Haloarcula sp. KBTZ06 TaxID=3402682 RepID=UPI003B42BF23
MEVDEAISIIRRQRQAFAYGIEAVHTLNNAGIGSSEPLKTLPTKTGDEPVYTSAIINPNTVMSRQLETATTNQLAMQLLVAVTEPVREVREYWPEDPEPTIRFLRLLRNGIAHGNEVSYCGSDPPPNTSWRGFEFTDDIEGETLFTQPNEYIWDGEQVELKEGLFESGDALTLTTDVLEILIEESDTFDVGNIVGLSHDTPPEWTEL